jgi:lysozyme
MPTIYEQLELHEGVRLKPYKDSVGKLTIGIGRNLDDKGITKKEAKYLCRNDVKDVVEQLANYEWFCKLEPVRQKVLIDMGFNLGVPGLLQFKNMIQALKDNEFIAAANEMKNSKWHSQVGERALRLEEMMRTGEDYE